MNQYRLIERGWGGGYHFYIEIRNRLSFFGIKYWSKWTHEKEFNNINDAQTFLRERVNKEKICYSKIIVTYP